MKKILCLMIVLICLTACGDKTDYPLIEQSNSKLTSKDNILIPKATGEKVYENDLAILDYSNLNCGYFMFKTKHDKHAKLKLRVIKADKEYTYDVSKEEVYITYPFSFGDGEYTIKLFENVENSTYAVVDKWQIDVKLENELYPFLYPNVIVDYELKNKAIDKSYELCKDIETDIERVHAVYKWIVANIDYDYQKAEEVTDKYVLPIIEETLDLKKGICFDYAALMACMLRVHMIPVKLVTGYVDRGYHAWVEVYIEDIGWINPDIYFKGEFTRLDPTYDSMEGPRYEGPYEDLYKY